MIFARPQMVSTAGRVTVGLVLLSIGALAAAVACIPLPNEAMLRFQQRTAFGQRHAIQLAPHWEDRAALHEALHALLPADSQLASAAVRGADGATLAQTPAHDRQWKLGTSGGEPGNAENVSVTIGDHGVVRGRLELAYHRNVQPFTFAALWRNPLVLFGVFFISLNGLFFRWYTDKMFVQLNPEHEIPYHVRSTLDNFAEGVLVLDRKLRIVLANKAFSAWVGEEPHSLLKRDVDSFAWELENESLTPWARVTTEKQPVTQSLKFQLAQQGRRTLLANSAPIWDELRRFRGVIVTLDDITSMEEKRLQLGLTLEELQKSRDELTQQNSELQMLATRDPLTGCLNRRTFFEIFDELWNSCSRFEQPLSCVMVDIDYFKRINDQYGHSRGDEVLREVGRALAKHVRKVDIVCRYGGEEFCLLLSQTSLEDAHRAAENLRKVIAGLSFGSLRITASFGVSANIMGASDAQALLDQADQCLYVAKRNGRNQVIRWDEFPGDAEQPVHASDAPLLEAAIPYPAVASLVSALAYRNPATAAHSMRVAELAVRVGRGLMTAKQSYMMEIGALLHDIGKIGVPDSILLKPGPLTESEWEVMAAHDRIGIEIVKSSFSSQHLIDILKFRNVPFAAEKPRPQTPQGAAIPLAARIVRIADAYDSMISDRVYRKGRTKQEAFAELRRWAGKQFDPVLVERFIEVVDDYQTTQLDVTSKQNAFQIGLQIEHLTEAIDADDVEGIKALAARLEATASFCQIEEIQQLAGEIRALASDGEELDAMKPMMHDLIDLCRSTQRVYIDAKLHELPDATAAGQAEPAESAPQNAPAADAAARNKPLSANENS